jgi:3-oxoacyl-[acyl-carrier protein] reductase
MGPLIGKVALVTGAARGIGAATAVRLAELGAAVAVLDRAEADAAATVETIEATGGSAIAVGCDVSDAEAVDAAVRHVAETLSSVDVLVNNAGIIRDNLLFKMSTDDWDAVMSVHLRGSFLLARSAQAFMVEKRWGKIVNLSSTSALGSRGQANYAAAKAGLQGLTKTLAIELGPFNINVNAVAPGFIETEMTKATAERIGVDFEAMKDDAIPRIPLRRIGTPADVANVIGFLCTDESAYVSGQVLYVAGGPAA